MKGKYGEGRIFRRGQIWWIAYCRSGKEYRESSRSTDEQVAQDQLRARLGAPKRDSLTVYELARRPEIIKALTPHEAKLLYAECSKALHQLRAQLRQWSAVHK
jgi:hypothetical protein